MDNDTQLVNDEEMIELEIDDQPEEEQDTGAQDQDEGQQKQRQGDPWKAMQSERAKRKKAEERAEMYESMLREHSMERAAGKSQTDPLDSVFEKYKDDENMAPIMEAMRALKDQVSKPRDDVMGIQFDAMAAKFPGANEHRREIIDAARQYGIDVRKAYFMLYGEDAINASQEDIRRQVELQEAARPSSTAQATPAGNAQPASQKPKKTIKVSRAESEAMKQYGITPAQYAQFNDAYKGGISSDALRQIYGGKSGAKKKEG